MLRIPLKKVALLLTAIALLAASVAHAEKAASGRVVVNVEGELNSPSAPTDRLIPVGLLLGGSITTTDLSVPPELNRVIVDFNEDISLQTAGLPNCPLARLESVSAETAKRECATAMVGHGNFSARIALPSQQPFMLNGKLLAFNGHIGSRPAILAQVTSERPLPLTFVIPFEIKRVRGASGTEVIGTIPPILGNGEITAFHLSLKRFYSRAGHPASLLRAKCAPFGDSFPTGNASFYFSDGTMVSITLPPCRIES
ncbi:MAG TPA: hypothetical protein VND98_04000 [Solirubrobacterales bacterium]|nr:hypothetical protein [Solirubrobacterales bacterium]